MTALPFAITTDLNQSNPTGKTTQRPFEMARLPFRGIVLAEGVCELVAFQKERRYFNGASSDCSWCGAGKAALSSLGLCITKPQGGGMVSLFFLKQQKEVLFNELELTSLLI